MEILYVLFLAFTAGIINGSYATPCKYVKKWQFENIWAIFSLVTFFIGPWLFIYYLAPNVFEVYAKIPASLLHTIIVGGILFGIGQIGFVFAFKRIGMGLSFVINIGLSTAVGSLLPLYVLHSGSVNHAATQMTFVGIVLIVMGLIVSYLAGKRRDLLLKNVKNTALEGSYLVGIVAAIIAGAGSVGQNYTFSSTVIVQQLALASHVSPLASSIIIWPAFLTASFVPYFLYMIFLNFKNKTFSVYYKAEKIFYVYALFMFACWFGSLVLYSKATQIIGHLGPVIIWPLFMAMIILASNFWGWRFGEWNNTDGKTRKLALCGVVLFIIAIGVFSYSAALSQH